MNSWKDIIINLESGLITYKALKPFSSKDVFIRKGEYKGYKVNYIKFESQKTFKISTQERVWTCIAALAKTIFSLGFALLFSQTTRDDWAKAWHGRKPVLAFISERDVRNNEDTLTVKQIVNKGMRLDGRLQDVSEDLQDDEEIVLDAISWGDSRTLQYASMRLRQNEKIVEAAVEKHGNALQYALGEPRLKKSIALKAVKSFGDAIEHIPLQELRDDPEIIAASEAAKKRSKETTDKLFDKWFGNQDKKLSPTVDRSN